MAKRVWRNVICFIAAGYCLVITTWLWRATSVQQPIWPLPALYLLELALLSVIGYIASLFDSPMTGTIISVIAGVFLAFMILGAMTIGLAYFPVVLLLIIAAILAGLAQKRRLLGYLGLFLLAAILQGALIFLLINLHFL